ncbi:MAG: ABC transporter ATP-binding protein [Lachnospiraceae bacterium]|nr:ABC transporter ATP-binding protein [Lachnospiraceae bacterium]
MLQINKLCKRYGKFQALNNLDLSIPKGEVFGFIGPNGAGKTTTMKIICGLLSATSGEVYVDGIDAIKNKKEIKRKIGYMPDFFGVYDNLKAMEYMEFYASMYGIVGDGARKTCRELMALVNLSDKEDAYVDGLSRGMKQRLCLARCLVHNPELLILDEPASGLDPRARFEVKEILKNLSSMKKTIIISSHILPELAEMCTSIGVMERGHLVINGSIDDILMNAKGSSPLHIQIVDNQETAIRLLKENPAVEKLSIRNDEIIVSYMGTEQDEANLLKQLILNDVAVSGFVREQGNLENIFMELTGPKQKEAV